MTNICDAKFACFHAKQHSSLKYKIFVLLNTEHFIAKKLTNLANSSNDFSGHLRYHEVTICNKLMYKLNFAIISMGEDVKTF